MTADFCLSYGLPCPNCGSAAERHTIPSRQLVRTQCATCDYLLIACQKTGRIIECYAPGVREISVRERTHATVSAGFRAESLELA